jgi:hypothetical protein
MSALARIRKNEKGFTIMGIAVGVVLSVIGILLFMQEMTFFSRSQSQANIGMDVNQLQIWLLENLNCSYSVSVRPGGCDNPANQSIPLMGNQNQTLVEQTDGTDYTEISNYYLAAYCVDCDPQLLAQGMCQAGQKQIKIKYSRRYDAQNAMANPMSGLPAWSELFPGIPLGCTVPPAG